MDTIWRNSEVSVKESLAEELLAHEAELSDDFYGRIVMMNCNIGHYKRKQAMWHKRVETVDKTRELFRDILEEEPTTVSQAGRKGKKRKMNSEKVCNEFELLQNRKRRKNKRM